MSPSLYRHLQRRSSRVSASLIRLTPKTVIRAGAGRFVTRMGLLDNIFPGGNSPFQPFVTVNNVSVDNPGRFVDHRNRRATHDHYPESAPEAAGGLELERHRAARASAELCAVGRLRRASRTACLAGLRHQPAHAGALQANPGVNVNCLRPYKGFAAIQEEESGVNSTYNSLQISWNRALQGGSSFGVTYTLSKSMDGGSNYRDIVPDTYNTSNLWGPSEYDTRHMLRSSTTSTICRSSRIRPISPGKLLGGWEIGGTAAVPDRHALRHRHQ